MGVGLLLISSLPCGWLLNCNTQSKGNLKRLSGLGTIDEGISSTGNFFLCPSSCSQGEVVLVHAGWAAILPEGPLVYQLLMSYVYEI